MPKHWWLYLLYSPAMLESIYIGITARGLKERYRRHLRASGHTREQQAWFTSLRAQGKRPLMIPFWHIEGERVLAEALESQFVQVFQAAGFQVLNKKHLLPLESNEKLDEGQCQKHLYIFLALMFFLHLIRDMMKAWPSLHKTALQAPADDR